MRFTKSLFKGLALLFTGKNNKPSTGTELTMTFLLVVIVSALASFLLSLLVKQKKNHGKNKQPPKVGGSMPLIGHLHLLRGSKLPQKVFADMADKYGPIFTINLGLYKAVVVNSSEMAKECLYVNDKATSGRIKAVAVELMCYNYAMFGFGPYGSYWRHMRKIVKLELLSNHRLNLLSHVWESEVKRFTRRLYDEWDMKKSPSNKVLLDMQNLFGDLVLNIIVSIILGRQSILDDKRASQFKEEVRQFVEHMGSFTIGDAIPFLRWLDIGGQEKAMKTIAQSLDQTIQGWLEEHKKRMSMDRKEENLDFMDVMLTKVDSEASKFCNFDSDTIIKSTCLSMLLGGSDTTQATLTWSLSLLLNNPEVLRKAKEELSSIVGKDRLVESSDIPNLVYLQAIIKETLRLYPPAPLMGPRSFIADSIVGNYHVPSGTRLIVNLYKMFRDPRVWDEPLKFRPERFLNTYDNAELTTGQHLEFIPFGSGRRMCPGGTFGLQLVHLSLASVLHAFEFSNPFDEPIDMSEGFGLTNQKEEPLEVLVEPILSTNAYV